MNGFNLSCKYFEKRVSRNIASSMLSLVILPADSGAFSLYSSVFAKLLWSEFDR